MTSEQNSKIPPGWQGGFAESNPAFAYPDPNLSSIPMTGNMDNINKLTRQQGVFWPEFSWLTKPGDSSSRCFQRFAHDISRLGYDDAGRIWSIICPQQGACLHNFACYNVEVTVTGVRGWVNEPARDLAADMTVTAKVWFSPSSLSNSIVKQAWELFEEHHLSFPFDKAHAIEVTTYKVGDPNQPIFPVLKGQCPAFEAPKFAQHTKYAYEVGYLEVEIGPIIKLHNEKVDTFNEKIMDLFNIASGNMLKNGNVLTWNVWFTSPRLVNRLEWATHAERWRKSIDADHHPGPFNAKLPPARYADGSEFHPELPPGEIIEDVLEIIESLL
ncbi:MAG: hypothetical protein F6K47_09330 [Symploca sp. SIO2E6]|nr:hypothetical protein [Symploca sp. SIO2E6]